jgi:hypothetical protein
MQQQRYPGISVSVGQTTVFQTTQQLAGIRVGDVEITVVDDISIGDDSPSAACPLVETVREPAKASTVKHAVTSSCRGKNG